ncbi:MAG: DUF1987 domain-containing protein [Desulfobacterales bacterium]|nr:DUF1987 domain-containing protein [Desulfobacterales bacterium]
MIKGTRETFGINFDAENGLLEIEGASYPEDALEFFLPLYDWVEEYISVVEKPITLSLKINYLNSSSSKCLFDMLDALEEYYKKGGEVKAIWYYEEDERDIMESGEELKEDFEFPFELVPF